MTKISLSPEEMQLVCDSEWILTKQRIIEKVYHLLGSLSEKMQLYTSQHGQYLPGEALQLPPKISKGEQYEKMPYVVLDYPRFFSKEHVFAIRTFFWWGHYFSSTLHLKGKFLSDWNSSISKADMSKRWRGFYISSAGNEFNFDLHSKNYQLNNDAGELSETVDAGRSFLKISRKVSFQQWNEAEQKLMEAFAQFAGLRGNV